MQDIRRTVEADQEGLQDEQTGSETCIRGGEDVAGGLGRPCGLGDDDRQGTDLAPLVYARCL